MLNFEKMHGLGNDFVVIDARTRAESLSTDLICAIADRHMGVGFDQLVIIESAEVDAHLVFFNSDGSTSAACGNATRCTEPQRGFAARKDFQRLQPRAALPRHSRSDYGDDWLIEERQAYLSCRRPQP